MQKDISTYPLFREIDCTAIAHNLREIVRTAAASEVMAVIKADGYGHGAEVVARIASDMGVTRFAVARLDEALLLRQAEIRGEILILGYTPPENCMILIENNLTQTVFSSEYARALQSFAGGAHALKIHLKLDTGMGRLGINPTLNKSGSRIVPAENAFFLEECKAVLNCSKLVAEGCFMHFESSDTRDKRNAARQYALFMEALELLESEGIRFTFRHAANSAAILSMPETHLDMVRPGIILYGLQPSHEIEPANFTLQPAMTIKGRIVMVKKVPAGFTVSYGHTYTTTKESVLATIPIGYADGYSRSNSSNGFMLVGGVRCPVAGRVCMDLTIIDVSGVNNVQAGDEVVILGKQGDEELSAAEHADIRGTINYEIVSSLLSRVPKIYKDR